MIDETIHTALLDNPPVAESLAAALLANLKDLSGCALLALDSV